MLKEYRIPKVTILIATYNGYKYLPYLFSSIYRQVFKDFRVMVMDNDSTDETVPFIRKNYPDVSIIENNKNLGFSRAYNQGISLAKSEYILVLNQDIVLDQKFLENILNHADDEPRFASFGGKLLRFTFDSSDLKTTDIIDSLGLKIFKSRKVINIGEGEKDRGQYQTPKEFFGISGALVLYRKKALEEIKFKNEYFDQDFFIYKEDIDLAWRLRNAGWKAIYIPSALAYHGRSIRDLSKESKMFALSKRNLRGNEINYLSYRNHMLTIIKSDPFSNIVLHSFRIFPYELKKFIYLVFFETKTVLAIFAIFKFLPKMIEKRKNILKNKKISNKELRKWME